MHLQAVPRDPHMDLTIHTVSTLEWHSLFGSPLTNSSFESFLGIRLSWKEP